MAAALRSRVPAKIDIGPVYSANPAERAKYSGAGQFVPVERELVFDIDLTDYDDVRTCGKEGHICGRCWPLMALAVNVIDAGLRQDFGFQHILWVYSGRRGIHCWVCDPAARRLTDEQRSAVASYFTVYKGHEKERAKLVGLGGSFKHPSLSRAEEALGGVWADVYLPAQRLLEDADMQAAMLRLLPDEDVAERVRGLWAGRLPRSGPNAPDASVQRWGQLADEVDRRAGAAKAEKNYKLERALRNAKAEIMFAFMYPRLDMEVSKKMNHLLKAPFCVHPKTGKVCVPIDPAAAWDFDPDAVPTIHQLCSQLSKLPAPASDDWRRTDMAACVDLFQSAFLDGLQAAGRGELAGKSRDALAASAARGDVSW